MNRGGEPPPSSTETSLRPDTTMIILRLRLPEPSLPPPQAASTPSSGDSPLVDSALGVVDTEHDTEGVLPPSTAGATADPLDSAADPVDSAAVGGVEGEETTPSTAQNTSGFHLSQGDASHSTASTSPVPRAAVERAVVPRLPDDMWADLMPDLLRQVAFRLRYSRRDFERMRAVCSAWREAIPSTVDPFLVLSRKKPEVHSELILLKIKRTNLAEDASFEMKVPLSPPPTGVSCWGSALGLMALQCHSNSRQILVFCLQCGDSKKMLPLPTRLTPRAMYLEPLTPQRFILLAEDEESLDGHLHVDSYGFLWPMEGGPWWLQAPRFANLPLRTMALDPGVLRAGADRDSIIIIDESGYPIDDEQITQIQLPPLLLPDGSSTRPWDANGQHLFMCNGMMFLVQIFDAPQEPGQVAVRLLRVEKGGGEEYIVTPLRAIGNYSVYLGPNQSFALPSIDAVIGRMANTVYVEDHRGSVRRPQVLAINIQSLSTVVIPFPNEMDYGLEDMLPAVWVGLPQQHDLFNHCRDDKCWRFWD